MQNLLIFLIVSLMFLLAGNGILKIFFEMIKTGQALDIVFGWQNMLIKFYELSQPPFGKKLSSKNKLYSFLEKSLGGCERCTSFWFMPLWFIIYYLMSKFVFHVWLTDNIHAVGFLHWLAICLINWTWYCVFHTLGADSGHFILTKLFKKKTNVV